MRETEHAPRPATAPRDLIDERSAAPVEEAARISPPRERNDPLADLKLPNVHGFW